MNGLVQRSIGPALLAAAGLVIGFLLMNLIVSLLSLDIQLDVPEARP